MKKKILYIAAIATFSIGCFFIWKNTEQDIVEHTEKVDSIKYEEACDFVENIVDWNTDGTGLAISLSNGLEVYAYKTEETDVYKGNRIISVVETDKGKIATKKNGKKYLVETITEEEKENE